jgi:spore coat protein A, manganese oxidase
MAGWPAAGRSATPASSRSSPRILEHHRQLVGTPAAPTPPAIALAGTQPHPAPPAERGWKDTVRANPGEITTIRMRFDLPHAVDPATGRYAGFEQPEQRYAMGCHILEHEDNDMMRPYTVAA